MAAAGRIQQAAVKMAPRTQKAATAERATAVVATIALAQRTTKTETPAKGCVVVARAGGAIYGLRADTGQVIWRRFVADEESGRGFPPLPLDRDRASDVVVVDPQHNEILRVEGPTGRLLWRHPLGEMPVAEPVKAGNRLLAPCGRGRLAILDLLTGDATSDIQLPQAFSTAPAYDAERALVFQVADQSNVFVLSASDGACRQVFHLGHESGAVAAPPVVSGNFLLVAVNESGPGPLECTIHVLRIPPPGGATDGDLLQRVQHVRLPGHVKTSPVVHGTRVIVVTARGGLHAFDLLAGNPNAPLAAVARNESLESEAKPHYLLALGRYFWVADEQLAKYEVQADRRRIVPRQITEQGMTFLQPLVAVGTTLVQIQRREGMPGVVVSAVRMSGPPKPAAPGEADGAADTAKEEETRKEPETWLWQTHLAVPLVGEPLVDAEAQKLTAVSGLAGMFSLDAKALGGPAIVDEPTLGVEPSRLLEPIRAARAHARRHVRHDARGQLEATRRLRFQGARESVPLAGCARSLGLSADRLERRPVGPVQNGRGVPP